MSRYYLQVEDELLRLHEAETGNPIPEHQPMAWDEATRLCLKLNHEAHEEARRMSLEVRFPPAEPVACPNCAGYRSALEEIERTRDAALREASEQVGKIIRDYGKELLFVRNENDRLTKALAAKDIEIQSYKSEISWRIKLMKYTPPEAKEDGEK